MAHLTMDNVAAMTVQYWHFSLEFMLDSLDKCGLRNLELWPGEPHYYHADYPTWHAAARRIREIKAQLDARGMKVIMYTPETLGYPFNPAGKGEGYRARTIDLYKRSMEEALEFGCDQLFVNPGWGLRDESRESAWERAVDTFQTISAYAARLGVEINLEQLQPYESNLVHNSADLQKMASDVNADNFNICLDIGAMAVAGEEPEAYFSKFADKIRHVHFSDANHEVPGDRDLPLQSYIDYLNSKGYDRYLSLEVNDSIYLEDPHAAFQRAADYMRTLLPEA